MAAAAAESSAAEGKMITLVSSESDGERFQLPEVAASLSATIRRMIEHTRDTDEAGIRLPNVAARTLAKIVDYLKKHAAAASSISDGEKPISEWDGEFISVGQALLYDVLLAANDLEIEGLIDLACRRVAEKMSGKAPDEIRRMFGIEDDFTPEQRDVIRRDNSWI